MAAQKDEHVLIDTYLRKSWISRMGSWLVRILIFSSLLLLISYIAWRMLSPQQQADLRSRSQTLDKTAIYLEEKGLIPIFVEKAEPEPSVLSAKTKSENLQATREKNEPIDLTTDIRELEKHLKPNPTDAEIEEKIAAAEREVLEELKDNPAVLDFKKRQAIRAEKVEFDRIRKEVINQERVLREKETQRYLAEGGLSISWKPWDKNNPVTWDDFKNQNIDEEITRWGAYISSRLVVATNGRTWNVFSVMIPESSWVRPGSRRDETLRHERLHFDITELFARDLRIRMAKEPHADFSKAISETYKKLSDFQAAYDNEVYNNRANQKRWEERVAAALKDRSNFSWVPKPQRMARAGYAKGQFFLGQIYDHGGVGFERSQRLAKKWYNLGIQNNETYAMNNMAVLHQKGIDGDPPNLQKAFRLYLRAAKAGNAIAQFNVGVCYWHGLGVKPNQRKAMAMFVESADAVPYARKALKILESGE